MPDRPPEGFWKGLPGWFAPDDGPLDAYAADGRHLDHKLLECVIACVPPETAIVEIGSFGGRSAFAMLEALRRFAKSNTIHCFDPYKPGTEADGHAGKPSIEAARDTFRAAIADHADGQIVLHEIDAADGGFWWKGEPVWLLHDDGEHNYVQVRAELAEWKRHLVESPALIFDDWLSYGGIRKACWEVFDPTYFACIGRGYSRFLIGRAA